MAWVLRKWTLRQKFACRRDRELERQEWVEGVIRETLADLQRCPHTSLSLHAAAPQEEALPWASQIPSTKGCTCRWIQLWADGHPHLWQQGMKLSGKIWAAHMVSATCPLHSIYLAEPAVAHLFVCVCQSLSPRREELRFPPPPLLLTFPHHVQYITYV